MSNITDKAKLLYSIEASLLQIKLRKLKSNSILVAISSLFFISFYAFLNVSAYQFLLQRMDSLNSSLLLSVINLVLFSVFLYLALRETEGEDEKLLKSLENKVIGSMQSDYDNVRTQADDITNKVKSIEGLIKGHDIGGNIGDIASLIKIINFVVKKYKK